MSEIQNVAFVDSKGEVVGIAYTPPIGQYEDKKTYSGQTAVLIAADIDTGELAALKYWKDNKWNDRVRKPAPYYDWKDYKWTLDSTKFWMTVRQERASRIAATDIYLLADYPIAADKLAEWKTYRAKLRDVPADNSSATSWDAINWPTPPT